MNGKSHIFYKKAWSGTWNNLVTYDEIYDLKMGNKVLDNGEYSWAYIVKNGNIQLLGTLFIIKSDYAGRNECGGTVNLVNARAHTRGCFENSFDHFYYLSYTDTSDFACGYWDSSDNINYRNVEGISVTKYEESPLEFC